MCSIDIFVDLQLVGWNLKGTLIDPLPPVCGVVGPRVLHFVFGKSVRWTILLVGLLLETTNFFFVRIRRNLEFRNSLMNKSRKLP